MAERWQFPRVNRWKIRWPDPDEGPYYVELVMSLDDRPEIVSFTVSGAEPEVIDKARRTLWYDELPEMTPINSAAARLPLRELLRNEVARLSAWIDDEPEEWGHPAFEGFRDAITDPKPPRTPGRPPVYDEEHWARVADTYTAAFGRGGNPTSAVAETFDTTKSTAGKWVARCRKQGLLAPTSQGRAAIKKKGN